MTANVAIYKDTVDDGPDALVRRVNEMCGSILENPRPDLRGDYLITDIVSVQIIGFQGGWGMAAIVQVERDPTGIPMAVAHTVEEDPLTELFVTKGPPVETELVGTGRRSNGH